MNFLKNVKTRLINIHEWNNIDSKIFKAKIWKIIYWPHFRIQSRKWKNYPNSDLTISKEKLNEILLSSPKNLDVNHKLITQDVLKDHFEMELLGNHDKLLIISKVVGKLMTYKDPLIACLLINTAISISKKLKGSYNPELIQLYLQKSLILKETGEIDQMFNIINDALILTLLNHKYHSEEMLKIFDSYRKFSLRIEEIGEHEIYSHKMQGIIDRLIATNKENEKNLTLFFYSFDIVNGLTSFSEDCYTVDLLKKYYKNYEDLHKSKLFKILFSQSNPTINIEDNDMYYRILYCNIKIKSFFKKDNKQNILKEMNRIVNLIKQKYGPYNHLLIHPYIFLIKFNLKIREKETVEKLFLQNWCGLIDGLYLENPLLSANSTLLLLTNIVSRDKDFKNKFSGLVNFVGENYSQVFNYAGQPTKLETNFLHAEVCSMGAYINRDDPKMSPWELIDLSAMIYQNVLGQNSEKFKRAFNLLQIINKLHKIE